MKNLILYLLFVCIACNSQPSFERFDQVISYLKNEHKFELGDKKIFIIIISNVCGSCTQQTIGFMSDIAKSSKYKDYTKVVILPHDQQHLTSKVSDSGFKVFIEKEFNLTTYGINFQKNVFLDLKGSTKVNYWNYLYMEDIYAIKTKYLQ